MSKAVKSVFGMKSRLTKIMESKKETEMLDMMCNKILNTLEIKDGKQLR